MYLPYPSLPKYTVSTPNFCIHILHPYCSFASKFEFSTATVASIFASRFCIKLRIPNRTLKRYQHSTVQVQSSIQTEVNSLPCYSPCLNERFHTNHLSLTPSSPFEKNRNLLFLVNSNQDLEIPLAQLPRLLTLETRAKPHWFAYILYVACGSTVVVHFITARRAKVRSPIQKREVAFELLRRLGLSIR